MTRPVPFRRQRLPRLRDVAILMLVLAPGAPPPVLAQQTPLDLDAAIRTITVETIRSHLDFLASDALRGRDTPSPGLAAAADYLETHHRLYGLEPAGEEESYVQRYPFHLMAPDPAAARVAFVSEGRRIEVVIGEEAFIDGGSEVPVDAPLVLVGSSDDAAPDADALRGSLAVFLLPGEWDQELWRRSIEQAEYARSAGATGVIHVLDPGFPPGLISQLSEALTEPSWRLGGDAFLPRIFIRGGAADQGLSLGNPAWEEAARAPGSSGSSSIDGLRLQASLAPRILESGTPPNVLAQIPGSDPVLRDEFIVLSAHFDHVGVGPPVRGDSIFNGADDNGSGTSALLEVARALSSLPAADRPGRTVVFAHVSGEEKGLLGSEWWTAHPTVPLEGVVANLNADMIGGNTHPDTVAVLGREYSSLGPLVTQVREARPELRIATVGDLWPGERLFFRSDQFNFMRVGIPSLFFFAGFHACYHRPCDEIDSMSPDKTARVARLLAYVVMEIANAEDPPTWNPGAWEEVERIIAGG